MLPRCWGSAELNAVGPLDQSDFGAGSMAEQGDLAQVFGEFVHRDSRSPIGFGSVGPDIVGPAMIGTRGVFKSILIPQSPQLHCAAGTQQRHSGTITSASGEFAVGVVVPAPAVVVAEGDDTSLKIESWDRGDAEERRLH